MGLGVCEIFRARVYIYDTLVSAAAVKQLSVLCKFYSRFLVRNEKLAYIQNC